jgi:integrase
VERLSDCLEWAKPRFKKNFPPNWTNPCRAVRKHTEHPRRHSLTVPQLRVLWDALDAEPNAYIRAYLRVLLLSGARKSEVLALKWADVDLDARRAFMRDTKVNGAEYLILPAPACAELAGLPRTSSVYVFPGRDISVPMSDCRYAYKAALKRARLPAEATLHDLRRSMGVALAAGGYSALAISAVLRNTSDVAAKVYVSIAAATVVEATDRAASQILGRP